eukprot:3631767-Amphidinium_carterae.1
MKSSRHLLYAPEPQCWKWPAWLVAASHAIRQSCSDTCKEDKAREVGINTTHVVVDECKALYAKRAK